MDNYSKLAWQDLKRILLEKIYGGRSELYPTAVIPHIIAAAWIDPLADIYTGDDHRDAVERAAKEGNKDAILSLKNRDLFYDYLRHRGWKDGFLTSEDNWVSREEAMDMAKKAKQIKAGKGKNTLGRDRADLDSYDVQEF